MSVEVKVPSVGESVTEVYIGEWRKSEGDPVKLDEDLVELESEKATFDAPAPASGTLEKILKRTGETAQIGEVIAYIADAKDGKKSAQSADTPEKAAPADVKQKEKQTATTTGTRIADTFRQRDESSGRAKDDRTVETRAAVEKGTLAVTPSARRLLNEHGLSAENVAATGPGGRLLKEDVLRELQTSEGKTDEADGPDKEQGLIHSSQSGRREEVVPMSPLRRRIARRLVKAQQEAALLTTFNEIDMSAVISLRTRYQSEFQEKFGVKLGFMSFFVKAAVDALMQFPPLNAEVRGTDIVYHNYFDIGVAVATDGGLVVPVVRNAELLSFAEIELAIHELAGKARAGTLNFDELQGGTFTISNGGTYGSLMSTPIVNPPQSGVLGMHAIQDRPVVRNGQIVVRPMMYVALSYDHRLVDGREAVTFLTRVKDAIEEPARMLIEA